MPEVKPLPWHDVERDREIGLQIKAQRKEMRLTLTELAGRIGISHEQLCKYKLGHDAIKASALERGK